MIEVKGIDSTVAVWILLAGMIDGLGWLLLSWSRQWYWFSRLRLRLFAGSMKGLDLVLVFWSRNKKKDQLRPRERQWWSILYVFYVLYVFSVKGLTKRCHVNDEYVPPK